MFKILFIIPLLFIAVLASEVFIAVFTGKKETFINPEPIFLHFGTAEKTLKYVILGDSTSAGQGASYEDGIAIGTAKHLGKSYKVSMLNLSVSGARLQDILKEQIPLAVKQKPDTILISAGANDVTHATSLKQLEKDLKTMINQLIESNDKVKIIITASPDMGAPPSIPQPLRYVAGLQTERVNAVFYKLINKKNVTMAPIAEKTGQLFRKDHTLFSIDRFHPNKEGYSLFIKVINESLDQALMDQHSQL